MSDRIEAEILDMLGEEVVAEVDTPLVVIEGTKGDPGAPGKDGHSPVVTATKYGKTTTISVDGAAIATVEDGADGKSAYAYAVESGYAGTETEFAAKLAEKMPTALPNPNALTFTGAVTDSYDGSAAVAVNIPSAVTDAHINELINTALNAIGVAEEGAY